MSNKQVEPELEPERIWINPSVLISDVRRERARISLHKVFNNDIEYARVPVDSVAPGVDQMWEALKAECCIRPDKAKLISFLSEEKFKKALAPFAAASPASKEEEAHPEDCCHKCGRPNVVWFAPNELWNKAVRATSEPEILCPVCFIRLAETVGIDAVWKVAPQNDLSLNQSTANAIHNAAQEVVDIAYRDRGQVPHRDTIVSIFSKHLTTTPPAPVVSDCDPDG